MSAAASDTVGHETVTSHLLDLLGGAVFLAVVCLVAALVGA
jgi:hypothetical protein